MQRSSFFIQSFPPDLRLSEILFVQFGKDFFPGDRWHLLPSSLLIRRERQTFRRLQRSSTIVFTVRTTLENLTDVAESERPNLVKEIRYWPRDIAEFKGRALWQRAVVGWCEGEDGCGA
jgi:hypothetical protein